MIRKINRSIILTTAFAVGSYGAISKTAFSHGGGGGGHGGEHGGHEEHHSEHHEEHHAEHHHEHHSEHHPYHPSEHHVASHHGEHHDDHFHHHHHDWHYGGWGAGPDYWGGDGLPVGGWDGGFVDGNTYVENESNTPAQEVDGIAGSANAVAENATANDNAAEPNDSRNKLAVDVWPELGIRTYSGESDHSQGLVVVRVAPRSPADRAGLKPGDVILDFNGIATPDDEALEAILDSAKGEFNLSIWDARTDRKSTISGKLDDATGAKEGSAG